MNITETDWAFQSIWSDFNAAFVGTSDETQGTVKKHIAVPPAFRLKAFNSKQTLNDKANDLARLAKAEKKMDVGEMQDVLVTEQKATAEHCKALSKRKPNHAAMRTPLKVSTD